MSSNFKELNHIEEYEWEVFLLLEEKGLEEDCAIEYLNYWSKQGSLNFYFNTNHTPLEHIKDMSDHGIISYRS